MKIDYVISYQWSASDSCWFVEVACRRPWWSIKRLFGASALYRRRFTCTTGVWKSLDRWYHPGERDSEKLRDAVWEAMRMNGGYAKDVYG